jgi:hypothetical protein
MRVPVTIDIPEQHAGSVVWMTEMSGLSSGDMVQCIVNFIDANIRSGNDLGHVPSGPAAVFARRVKVRVGLVEHDKARTTEESPCVLIGVGVPTRSRRAKLLICLAVEGSLLDTYSQFRGSRIIRERRHSP